ncbi:phospholipase D-like domain-containing protein [Halobacillus sp. SY10]|uniref:phospholipase D-like domain-containing protein n=1 Tax=Halobacillus sp. SY10 TaxID=3381356 RepID=UPI00387942D4
MFKEEFTNFKIVLTEEIGEHTYEEVLQSFSRAKKIYISSFGVTIDTRYGNKLLNTLINLNNVNVVKVLTNLRSEEEFESFKELLNNNVPSYLKFYFNTTIHSKIIVTDEIAYIGSENYTEYSGKGANMEAGIITKDKSAISYLMSSLDSLLKVSYPALDFDKYRKRFNLVKDLREFKEEIEWRTHLFNHLFNGDPHASKIRYEPQDKYNLDATNDHYVEDWINDIKKYLNLINGKVEHELRGHDEPVSELDPSDIGKRQHPKDKVVKRTKNDVINSSNIQGTIKEVRSSIDNMDYSEYKGLSDRLDYFYSKSDNPEEHIEEYGGSLDSFIDERDYPMTEQEGYKRLINNTLEMIDNDIKELEEVYKKYQEQIINTEDNLKDLSYKLDSLIKVLQGS